MIWWSLKLWESRNWTAGRETGESVNLRDAFSSLLPPCQLILKAIKRKLCIVVIITHMWNIENLVMHMMFQTVSLHYIYISHIILHIYICVCVFHRVILHNSTVTLPCASSWTWWNRPRFPSNTVTGESPFFGQLGTVNPHEISARIPWKHQSQHRTPIQISWRYK